jgi:hypothetical protein
MGFQTMILASEDPERRRPPVGVGTYSSDFTKSAWPLNSAVTCRVEMFQARMRFSQAPAKRVVPSGERARQVQGVLKPRKREALVLLF